MCLLSFRRRPNPPKCPVDSHSSVKHMAIPFSISSSTAFLKILQYVQSFLWCTCVLRLVPLFHYCIPFLSIVSSQPSVPHDHVPYAQQDRLGRSSNHRQTNFFRNPLFPWVRINCRRRRTIKYPSPYRPSTLEFLPLLYGLCLLLAFCPSQPSPSLDRLSSLYPGSQFL